MSAGLKNLSLFQQLFIPMIVVSVISASITMFAGLALRDAVFVAKSSLKNSEEFVRRLQDVEISIASMRLLSLRHLTAENARLMEQTERDLEVQERALHEGIKMLVGRNIEGQNLAIRVRSDLEETFNRYWPQINKATRLSRDFEKESAFSLWFEAESIYGVRHGSLFYAIKIVTPIAYKSNSACSICTTHRARQVNAWFALSAQSWKPFIWQIYWLSSVRWKLTDWCATKHHGSSGHLTLWATRARSCKP